MVDKKQGGKGGGGGGAGRGAFCIRPRGNHGNRYGMPWGRRINSSDFFEMMFPRCAGTPPQQLFTLDFCFGRPSSPQTIKTFVYFNHPPLGEGEPSPFEISRSLDSVDWFLPEARPERCWKYIRQDYVPNDGREYDRPRLVAPTPTRAEEIGGDTVRLLSLLKALYPG